MFEKGKIIEALHPETRCWLTAHFIKKISDTQFEIEWYDYELKKSFSTPTVIVSEVREHQATLWRNA